MTRGTTISIVHQTIANDWKSNRNQKHKEQQNQNSDRYDKHQTTWSQSRIYKHTHIHTYVCKVLRLRSRGIFVGGMQLETERTGRQVTLPTMRHHVCRWFERMCVCVCVWTFPKKLSKKNRPTMFVVCRASLSTNQPANEAANQAAMPPASRSLAHSCSPGAQLAKSSTTHCIDPLVLTIHYLYVSKYGV